MTAIDVPTLPHVNPDETDEERSDRVTHRWGVLLGASVALFVLYNAVLGYAVITTHQVVTSHSQEITAAKRASDNAAAAARTAAAGVASIKSLQISANSNHNGTLGYLEAICEATPGCVVIHSSLSP